jgi:anti-anti-sigma regulatory factor
MTSSTIWSAADCRAACERLESAGAELVLDFSEVDRLDPSALAGLDELAAQARERSVKLVLRGVRVEVYRVLKLTATAAQFTFVN